MSSQDYPVDNPTISVQLASGDYQVTLRDGWTMEYSANGQPYAPIEAALVSPNPLGVTIVANDVTAATFQFVVNGSLINFGPGTLSIDIEVNEISLSIDLSSNILEIEGPSVDFAATIVNPNGTLFPVMMEMQTDQGAGSGAGNFRKRRVRDGPATRHVAAWHLQCAFAFLHTSDQRVSRHWNTGTWCRDGTFWPVSPRAPRWK